MHILPDHRKGFCFEIFHILRRTTRSCPPSTAASLCRHAVKTAVVLRYLTRDRWPGRIAWGTVHAEGSRGGGFDVKILRSKVSFMYICILFVVEELRNCCYYFDWTFKDLLRHDYFDFAKPSTKSWVVGVSWGIASSHSCSRGAPGRGFLANE